MIREDPTKTPRAVEALRIALGLSTGGNPLTVILLEQAPLLLAEEQENILDGEILEKHLPVLKELRVPFVVPLGSGSKLSLNPGLEVREASSQDIASLIARTDRVLAF
ncbi:MAG: hypothetical protein HY581_01170 [Nitrospirae bacterium]|nr:hypothetical protein [Nitrospirota bacterium]